MGNASGEMWKAWPECVRELGASCLPGLSDRKVNEVLVSGTHSFMWEADCCIDVWREAPCNWERKG